MVKTKKLDIYCLVETHAKSDDAERKKWEFQWGYKIFSSFSDGRSKSVTILFNNTFSYTLHQSVLDPVGRYVILDVTIFDTRLSLAALYGPNIDSPEYFHQLSRKLAEIGNSSIIMCGDFNVVQDYDMDTAGYERQNNPKAQQAVFDMMESLEISDIFRICYPDVILMA